MNHFKLVGPKTTRDFDIEDDEMVIMEIVKISDWQEGLVKNISPEFSQRMQNVEITDNA